NNGQPAGYYTTADSRGLEPDDAHRPPFHDVDGVDEADGAGLEGHHHRVGPRPAPEEVHPLEEVALGDTAGGEDQLVPAGQLLGGVDLVEVDTHRARPLGFAVVARAEAPENLSPETAQRHGREDALGRAAGAHHRVDAGPRDGDGDRRRDVAVRNQLDPGAGVTDVLDQLRVAGSVEDDDGEILNAPIQRVG